MALVELIVLADQLIALRLEVDGHLLKGRAETANVVARKPVIELDVQIALADFLGRAYQLPDRHHEAVCKNKPCPNRRGEQRQRQQHIHEPEDELHAAAHLLQLSELQDVDLRALQEAIDIRIDWPDRVKIHVALGIELFERRYTVRQVPA